MRDRAWRFIVGLVVGLALGATLSALGGISGGGAGIAPNRHISGLRAQVTGDSTISVTSGVAMDRGATVLLSNAATITTTTPFAAWANGNDFGLDTGAEAANTWYHMHYIRDSGGGEGVLLSTSKTAPSMPAGAALRRWIGAVRNDASSNLLQGEYEGEGATRRWVVRREATGASASSDLRVLSAGAATTDTLVSCASFVPPQATFVMLSVFSGAAVSVYVLHGAETTNYVVTGAVSSITSLPPEIGLTAGSEFTYRNSAGGGSTTIDVLGYTLALDGSD